MCINEFWWPGHGVERPCTVWVRQRWCYAGLMQVKQLFVQLQWQIMNQLGCNFCLPSVICGGDFLCMSVVTSNHVYEIKEALIWRLQVWRRVNHGCHIQYYPGCGEHEDWINVCEWLRYENGLSRKPHRKVLWYDRMGCLPFTWQHWMIRGQKKVGHRSIRCKWWVIWVREQVFSLETVGLRPNIETWKVNPRFKRHKRRTEPLKLEVHLDFLPFSL